MRKLIQWLLSFFNKEAPTSRKNSKTDASRFETGGLVYFGDLLDNLGDYIEAVKTLKHHSPDAYNYYRQVGGGIGSSDKGTYLDELPTRWKDRSSRPGMVMTHLPSNMGQNDVGVLQMSKPEDEEDEKVYPVFIYLMKHRYVQGVQFTNTDTYECTILYRNGNKSEVLAAIPFYVAVDEDNNISVLLCQVPVELTKGKARGQVVGTRWVVPQVLKDLSKDHNSTPKAVARDIFLCAANFGEQVGMGLLVRAKKDGYCAAFAIDLLRTPYFFKGRDKTVTSWGRTKPIFHIVRTHQRKTGSIVKTHFRGLRRFMWLGYDVIVSMPGLHHSLPTHLNITAHEGDDPMLGLDERLTSKEVGERVAAHLDS